jgi:hypothetical protein
MWSAMFAGTKPFRLNKGQLQLVFAPALPGWLFPQDGQVSFAFLGGCRVTYHNPKKLDTFDAKARIRKIELHANGQRIEIGGDVIGAPHALAVREGKVEKIDVYIDG